MLVSLREKREKIIHKKSVTYYVTLLMAKLYGK